MSDSSAPSADAAAPVIRFRNYQPKDAKLVAAEKGIGTLVAPPPPPSVVAKREQEVEAARVVAEHDDTINIAPKKPNWDLKRDVEAKLARLERATVRAIGDILREKAAAAANTGDSSGGQSTQTISASANVSSANATDAGPGRPVDSNLDVTHEGFDAAALARAVNEHDRDGTVDED